MKILIFLLSCKIMFATIIHVPDDVETIQGGLNLSESGDTVLVAPGTYVENIIWPPDKDSIKLIGSGQDNSIIDGDQNGIVILMAAFEGVDSIEDSEISNFTIQNGFTAGSGGGIVISSANVTLKNLTIKGNSGNYGGGLNTLHSFVNLRNSVISDNISNYSAGGIALSVSTLLCSNTVISGNYNYGDSGSGGLFSWDSNVELTKCLLSENFSGGVSSAVIGENGSNIVIRNCTISNNLGETPSIFTEYCDVSILNTINFNNSNPGFIFEGGTMTVNYSNIQNGWDGEGNIDLDPQFTDPAYGDFTLLPTSPCIDAGTPFFVWEGDTLVNMSEDEYFGSAPDMGAYEFNPNESGNSVDYSQNWNLISLPVQTDEYGCNNIDETTLYSFEEGGYVNTDIDEMEIGTGYWLRFVEDENCVFSGFPINETTITLTEDWNLIGSISSPVDVNTVIDENNLIIPGTVYGFDGGYFEAETIEPGYGYWLRSSGEGEIILSSTAPTTRMVVIQKPEKSNTLTFVNQTLYFGNKVEIENVLSYSLPPKPPAPSTDIRFSSDTKLCTSDECVVKVTNNGKPLKIECEIKEGESWEIVDESGEVFECSSVNVLDVGDESETFVLRKSTSPQTPTEFVLHPAYPNPFNPVTTIRFSVPELSEVNVSIYDMRGRLVETLVDKKLSPGNHSVQWNAMDQSSSMYFIRLARNGKSEILKVVLIK